MDNFIFITHLDVSHLDSERCVCVAAVVKAMLRLPTSEYSVYDIQRSTHVHICSDVKPRVVTATFNVRMITAIILLRKEIC